MKGKFKRIDAANLRISDLDVTFWGLKPGRKDKTIDSGIPPAMPPGTASLAG
jgi:hypothetical protein